VSALAAMQIETRRGTSVNVVCGGSGPDVLFLHGAGGLLGVADPFLVRLAESCTVHAPELPGYGDSVGEELLEDMLDFTLHGWDCADALGLDRPHVVGHSMGGMIAAEMAAVDNRRAASVSLIAPAGLWLDDYPIPDIFGVLPFDLPALLFHDPAAGAGALTGGMDFDDPEALVDFFIRNARQLGTAGKLLFPIPNRRLSKRIHRLTAPTLLVWGDSDSLIEPVYAEWWQQLVPHADLVTIAEAGHMALLEQPDQVAAAIEKHIEGAPSGAV
jgi:pimeloyl-ACP methyl ester carboxylesterase